jgi:hypothetical protein
LKTRRIDVEKNRPGARRDFGLGGKEPVGLETPLPPEGCPATDDGKAAPVESSAASPQPGTQALAPAASASDLPPIAAKADDLEAIKKAVDDAAAVGGGLWLSYLFVLFYLAVAAGAVTHEDLFFEHPVKLPFLNIELPLLAFFFLAPILFIVVHAYTLVHLVFLTDKAKRYDAVMREQIYDQDGLSTGESQHRKVIRDELRRQLPSNIFIQFIAGPADIRDSWFGWLLRTIAWTTLVIAPVLLLLLFQIQFLPYHNSFITWIHRITLSADLWLLWWLWRKILSGRQIDARDPMASLAAFEIGLILIFLLFVFSFSVVTFPGEWQEDFLTRWDQPKWTVTPHNWLFSGPVDPTTRRRTSLFSSTLVLTGLNIYEGLGIDDPERIRGRDFVFRARGRDLRGAVFDYATVPKVDFTRADLQGASLDEADLHIASLEGAQLQGRTSPGHGFRARHLTPRIFRGLHSAARSFRAPRSTLPT